MRQIDTFVYFLRKVERKRRYYYITIWNTTKSRALLSTTLTFLLCITILIYYVSFWPRNENEKHLHQQRRIFQRFPDQNNNISSGSGGGQSSKGIEELISFPLLASTTSTNIVNVGGRVNNEMRENIQKQETKTQAEKSIITDDIFENYLSEGTPLKFSSAAAADLSTTTTTTKQLTTVVAKLANKLDNIFKNADKNEDGILSFEEISKKINFELRKHFSEALENNFQNYMVIDINPRDGLITWKEYLEYIFKKNGYSNFGITPENVKNKSSNYQKLPKSVRLEIARSEVGWSEAASDPDFLTVNDFLQFNHQEASPGKLISLVEDTFNTFDSDGNGLIASKEFETTFLESGAGEMLDNVFRKDFKIIDADQNGQINRLELMKYLDPRNKIHSNRDAKNLIKSTDLNKDGKLSLDELNQNLSIVVKSKFYDVSRNLHNLD